MANYAIIGGGYTGLVAAFRLAKAGNKVTIFEAEKEVGGLTSGFNIENTNLEKAYHHIFNTDTAIIEFAREIKIENRIEWVDSSVSMCYNKKIYPFKSAIDLLKFYPLPFIDRIRLGLVTLYLQRQKDYKRFENISALAWMKKFCGKNITKVIWEPLLKGKFDKYYDQISMAWLWTRIHIRTNSREKGVEKLGYFKNGFQTFTESLSKQLADLNVEIHCNTKVNFIESDQNGKVLLTVNNDILKFDACIATIPTDIFSNLINHNEYNEYKQKLCLIKYIGVRILIFVSTQDLGEYYWNNINDGDIPFLVFINQTKLIEKKNYNNKFVYYIASYLPHDHHLFACADEELEKTWFFALKKIFTNFDSKLIQEKHFFRFKNAQHIVTNNYKDIIPDYATPIKNVYLANFSQIYPEDRGTNQAVREGNKIAEIILKKRDRFKNLI